MGIGERLRSLRHEKNMTLKQVGEAVGVTPNAISTYEHESRKPSHNMIQKLADLYETTADNIIGIQTDQMNFKNILKNTQLHWDGIPLREDELDFIRQFLELRARDKQQQKEKEHEPCS